MTIEAHQVHGGAPWLPGGEPGPGRIARADIQTRADIAAIEKYDFAELLGANTLLECIERAAKIDPDKTAIKHLISADTSVAPRIITYRELDAAIRVSASLFQRLSGEEKPVVGIILPMLPEGLIATLGAASVGVGCPINPFLEIKHVVSILNVARATVLLAATNAYGPGAWDNVAQIVASVPTLKHVLIFGSDDPSKDFELAMEAQAKRGVHFTPVTDPFAEAIYLATGGTTGSPKLVPMTHRGLLVNAWIDGAIGGAATTNVVGHAMPNFHAGGLVTLAFRALIYGQTLLTLTSDGFRSREVIGRFWDIARHYGMTTLLATPATAAALLAVPDSSSEGHPIRTFHCGASTIPVALANAFHEKFGVWLRELWGMTEVHGVVSGHPNGIPPVIGSVGVQMPHQPVKAFIIDDAGNFVRECEPGERGVLAVSGPGVIKGYLSAAADANCLVRGAPDGKAWFNSGDLGMIDSDGYIWMFGRAKDVIVRGGHNIDANVIEEALGQHPAVQLAAAIGKPAASIGELPVAYVQLKPGAAATVDELMKVCRDHISERAAIPVSIVILDQMPVTAVGKINKPPLRRDIVKEVARDVATAAAEGGTTLDVTVDEAGTRPVAIVKIATPPNAALEAKLKDLFRTYDFSTRIEFTGET